MTHADYILLLISFASAVVGGIAVSCWGTASSAPRRCLPRELLQRLLVSSGIVSFVSLATGIAVLTRFVDEKSGSVLTRLVGLCVWALLAKVLLEVRKAKACRRPE